MILCFLSHQNTVRAYKANMTFISPFLIEKVYFLYINVMYTIAHLFYC